MSAVEIVAETLAAHEKVVEAPAAPFSEWSRDWSCECGTVLHVREGAGPLYERVDAAHREHQGHAVIVALGKTHKIKARTKAAS